MELGSVILSGSCCCKLICDRYTNDDGCMPWSVFLKVLDTFELKKHFFFMYVDLYSNQCYSLVRVHYKLVVPGLGMLMHFHRCQKV